MFPTPGPSVWIRCARCRTKTRLDRAVHGFGRACAERLGLIAASPRLHTAAQDGPDLFAAFEEDDACDGWDR